jgi:uncharacterized protein
MKRILFVCLITVAVCGVVNAQNHPYKVVFDLTSTDTLNQMALTSMMQAIARTNPDAEMEVVMYGKGFELVMPEKSKFTNEVTSMLKNPRVSFAVCEMAMKKHNVNTSMFVEGVRTVPDGVKELVMKQQDGWGYIKAMR